MEREKHHVGQHVVLLLLRHESLEGRVLVAVVIAVVTSVSAAGTTTSPPLDRSALDTSAVEQAVIAFIVVLRAMSSSKSLVDLILIVAYRCWVSNLSCNVIRSRWRGYDIGFLPMPSRVLPQ